MGVKLTDFHLEIKYNVPSYVARTAWSAKPFSPGIGCLKKFKMKN